MVMMDTTLLDTNLKIDCFLIATTTTKSKSIGPELCTKISNYADYRPFKGTHSFMLVKSQNFYLYVNYVGFSHAILFF